ncbi:hypothetical protein AB835_13265 [Candidatus Endobugula sertula]|uniref:Uncharacterized protein n=1 Tax=Candidatus Endobugula sertula TaxID=62101 RepID=A0A1D2QM11_9GAMM|nr:hypothetical protein AB835_13265 [Candidatus Endobugula sertula]
MVPYVERLTLFVFMRNSQRLRTSKTLAVFKSIYRSTILYRSLQTEKGRRENPSASTLHIYE